MITRTKVETFIEHLMCDKCGDEMTHDMSVSGEKPPYKYGHVCGKCGEKKYIEGKTYPRVAYDVDHTLRF